jgi:hypothetical protein
MSEPVRPSRHARPRFETQEILENQETILREITLLSQKVDSVSEAISELKGPFAEKLRGFIKREISSKVESIFHQRTTDQKAE